MVFLFFFLFSIEEALLGILSSPRWERIRASVVERYSKITTLWPASRHKYGTDGGSGATIWTVSGQRWGTRSVTSVDPSLRGLYRFDQNSQHHVDAAKYGNRYPCSCVPTRHAFFSSSSSSSFLNRFHDRFEISFSGLRHRGYRFSLHFFLSLFLELPRFDESSIMTSSLARSMTKLERFFFFSLHRGRKNDLSDPWFRPKIVSSRG